MRFTALFLMIYLTSLHAFDLSKLTKAQRDTLYNGQFVLIAHEIENAPWPKLEILKIVSADALEFGAFFSDFEMQVEYVPELIKAKILVGDKATSIPVDYEMNMPWPISNAKYVHVHEVSLSESNEPRISWTMKSSSVAESVDGHAHFYRMGDKTLWHYQAFMRPKSILAGLFSGTMRKDTLNSLQKTEDYFFKLKKESSPKLLRALERFQNHFKTQ